MEKLEVANTLAQHFARITKLAINWIGWNCQSLTLEAAEKKAIFGFKEKCNWWENWIGAWNKEQENEIWSIVEKIG